MPFKNQSGKRINNPIKIYFRLLWLLRHETHRRMSYFLATIISTFGVDVSDMCGGLETDPKERSRLAILVVGFFVCSCLEGFRIFKFITDYWIIQSQSLHFVNISIIKAKENIYQTLFSWIALNYLIRLVSGRMVIQSWCSLIVPSVLFRSLTKLSSEIPMINMYLYV